MQPEVWYYSCENAVICMAWLRHGDLALSSADVAGRCLCGACRARSYFLSMEASSFFIDRDFSCGATADHTWSKLGTLQSKPSSHRACSFE